MNTNELSTTIGDPSPAAPSFSSSTEPAAKELPYGVWDDPNPELTVAVIADFNAGWKMDERRELAQYEKQHVAIYNGKVVGAGKNSEELRDRMVREGIVPEERLVVIFVGDDTI